MRITSFTFSILVLFTLSILVPETLLSQNQAQKPKQEIKIHPVKKDTADSQKARLQQFSNDSLFMMGAPLTKITDPKELEAQNFYKEGSKKARAGDYAGAATEFTKSLGIKEMGNTYIKRGFAYLMTDNLPMALQDFTEAIRLTPGDIQAFFGRGIVRYQLHELDGAREDLEYCVKTSNRNPMAYNYLAAVCFLQQDFQCALENYTEVIRLDPSYPDIYTNRGMMRHYVRDFKGAIQDYDEAIKRKPESASPYNNRAAAKMMQSDFQGALADLDKAISINPNYSDAYDNRGRVKHKLGDLTGACSDWQKAYSLGLQTSRDLILKYCK